MGYVRCLVAATRAKVIFDVEDGRGRKVRLYRTQWKHICERHPEMADALEGIKLAISDPDVVSRSESGPRDPDCERRVNSRRDAHPSYKRFYVRVPIEYCEKGNWVVTSYVNPLPPEGELIYVRVPPR
jgi:hypothetical protein